MEHGEETWQIFKSKLVGRLAAKECLLGLTMPRPEMAPPLAAAAVRRQREEEIRKYDEWDMKAYGLICQSMLSCPSAQLLIAQIVPDGIGCAYHARALMALLNDRFDLVEVRTEAKRLGEVYAARLQKNESVTNFVAELTNLISRVHQINPNALAVDQQIVRLCDGLSNGEPELNALVQSITTMQIFRGNEYTFQEACRQALNFDVSVIGKERMRRVGLKTAALEVVCYKCGKPGHRKSECRQKDKGKQKGKDRNKEKKEKQKDTPPAENPDKRGRERERPTCGKCGKVGHEDKECWDGDEAKRAAWFEAMKAKRQKREEEPRGREKIRSPSAFRRTRSLSALWKVGALRRQLAGHICVDTGAMGDLMIIREEKWFETLELEEGFLGTAAEGGKLDTAGVGTAGEWEGVLWAPTVSYSVVSGSRIRSKGYVLIDSSPPVIATPGRFEAVLVGQHIDGLPCFEMEAFLGLQSNPDGLREDKPGQTASRISALSTLGRHAAVASLAGENSIMLWHCRFGHVGFQMLREMYRRVLVQGMPMERALLSKNLERTVDCDACARAGRRRASYHARLPDPRVVTALQLLDKQRVSIVCDWLVLVNCSSREGYLYVLMLVDVYSRRAWGYPARQKSDALALIRKFYAEEATMLEGGFNFAFVHFHSDSAAEFLSAGMAEQLTEWGVQQTASPRDTPELNGIVEQTNGRVYQMALAMLLQADLPSTFWWDAVNCVVNVIHDMVPAATTKGWMTPHEYWTGTIPNVSFLRVFGSTCYVSEMRSDNRKNFEERRLRGIMIGYSHRPIGWVIITPDLARSTVVSTNVVFNEVTQNRGAEHYKDIQQARVPFGSEEREVQDFKWLEGTSHLDDENQLLYRTTRVGTWRNPITKDRVIVGWRAPVTPDGIGVEEKRPIHIADVLRMTQTTPGQQPEDPPGQDERQLAGRGLATPPVQLAGMSRHPAAAHCEVGAGLAVALVRTSASASAQTPPEISRARKRSCESKKSRQSAEPAVTEGGIDSQSGRGKGQRPDRSRNGLRTAGGCLPMVKSACGLVVSTLLYVACAMYFEFAAMVHAVSHWTERPVPKTHKEAMNSPWSEAWTAAEEKERKSIRDKDVLGQLQPIPPGRKVRTMRYVYKWKPPLEPVGTEPRDPEPRAKARLTCRDFHWLGEVGETYAPTGRGLTFRLFMLIALIYGLVVEHVDVETAFLNAKLGPNEEYWTTPLPEEIDTAPPGWGYRLKKSIYGLRVAPRHWYHLLSDCLLKWGLTRSVLDTCLFWKWTANQLFIVMIYVDDILIAGPPAMIEALKAHLASWFTITKLGPVKKYLGVRVDYRPGRHLRLDQAEYTEEVLNRHSEHWKPVFGDKKLKKTPLPSDAQEYISFEKPDMNATEKSWFDSFPYRSIIGCLLYLCLNTRPDIAFAVGFLARASSNPTYGACYCAAWLMSYLKRTYKMGIEFLLPDDVDWHAWVDADWAGELARRRSTSGFLIFLCGGPVAWGSKLMQIIATSSMQAEFQSYYYCITTLLYMKHLFEELGIEYKRKVPLFTDAQAAQRAALNPEAHQRTKHFEVKYWWVRSFVGEGAQAFIEMIYIPTQMMVVDNLTKVASPVMTSTHTDHMMGYLGRTTDMVLAAKKNGGWASEEDRLDSSFSEDSDV